MLLPQAIFIDTCILDQEHYCFESTQLVALVEAAKGKNLKLLLPAPTKQEMEDHIYRDTEEAIAAIKNARKTHPILHRLKSLPSREDAQHIRRKLEVQILGDWKRFCKTFTFITLDYAGVKLDEVMRWYGQGRPPFGTGEKRKEFPDAFAFAILKEYAEKSGERLAIVSADNDFKAACPPVPNFYYFPSLPALTDALLSDEEHHKAAMALVEANRQLVADAVAREFPDRGFDHAADPNERGYVDEVTVTGVDLDDVAIIGLGHESFTMSFSATVKFTAHAEYDDPDSWVSDGEGDVMYLHTCSGTVSDEATVTGSMRFTTNSDWAAITETIAPKIDDENIEVEAGAPQCDEPGDYDYGEPPSA